MIFDSCKLASSRAGMVARGGATRRRGIASKETTPAARPTLRSGAGAAEEAAGPEARQARHPAAESRRYQEAAARTASPPRPPLPTRRPRTSDDRRLPGVASAAAKASASRGLALRRPRGVAERRVPAEQAAESACKSRSPSPPSPHFLAECQDRSIRRLRPPRRRRRRI